MHARTRTARSLAAATAIATLLAGCADAADPADPAVGGDAEVAADAPSSADDETDVTVTLTEFAIELSRTSFEDGVDYTFTIVNAGSAAHELLALGEDDGAVDGMDHDSAHDDHDSDEMQAMHDAASLSVTGDQLPPGATVTRTASFDEAGDLEFACHLPGHYEAGMLTTATVTAG